MAKLIITRTNDWNNLARNINIYLDGQKIDSILNGEKKEFDISNGKHILRAKIDWCSSGDYLFSIDDDIHSVTLSGFKYATYLLPLFVVTFALHFILNIFFNFNLILILAIPIILILSYYLTFGRNKYLVLNKN